MISYKIDAIRYIFSSIVVTESISIRIRLFSNVAFFIKCHVSFSIIQFLYLYESAIEP